MKTIAFLVFTISQKAGTERAVTNLCNALAELTRYKVIIISVNDSNGSPSGYPLNSGVKVISLGLGQTSNKIKKYNRLVNECNALVKSEKIDIFIGTTHALNSLMLLVRNIWKRIACEHMNYNACPKISKIIRQIVYPRLSAIVLLTHIDAEKYTFVSPEKKYVIPNISSFSCEGISTLENKRIITVGRLTEQKGYDILIKAIREIKKDMNGWVVDIFGDGEVKSQLVDQIDAAGLTGIVRINEPTNNILKEYLNSSIYIMTSRWEGLPMVLIEAQSCGLPIVSFNCPEGPADIVIDEKSGYLVENGNISELCVKLKSLMNSSTLRYNFGANAVEDSKRFSKKKIVAKWIDMIEK